MIRGIVAIDEERGMADENGIPWHGKLKGDEKFFVDSLQTGRVLMGYGTYLELAQPFGVRENIVATHSTAALKHGFKPIVDVRQFLETTTEDVWNIGGPALLASTLDLIDELLITQLTGSFHCTKFLPEYKSKFALKTESEPITENGITYKFQTWAKR